jgi:hypothetical protein
MRERYIEDRAGKVVSGSINNLKKGNWGGGGGTKYVHPSTTPQQRHGRTLAVPFLPRPNAIDPIIIAMYFPIPLIKAKPCHQRRRIQIFPRPKYMYRPRPPDHVLVNHSAHFEGKLREEGGLSLGLLFLGLAENVETA